MRGSVGSAQVWNEAQRGRGASAAAIPSAGDSTDDSQEAPPQLALAPDEFRVLVAGIVRVTLETRLTDCAPARRAELARELERRLLHLFGAPTPAEPGPERSTNEETRPRSTPTPAPEPEPAPEPGPARLSLAPPADPVARALALVLEDRLARLGGPLAARIDLRQRLIELALSGAVELEESSSDASRDELHRLDLLQRRAQKLEHSLHDTRAALAYVAGLEHVETGIASIYRSVQGLASADPRRKQKQGALEALFQANLTLQKSGA